MFVLPSWGIPKPENSCPETSFTLWEPNIEYPPKTIKKLHCLGWDRFLNSCKRAVLSSSQMSHAYTMDLYNFHIALEKASIAPQNKGTPSASLAHIGNKDTLSL